MELVTETKKEIDVVEYVIDYQENIGDTTTATIDGKGNIDITSELILDGYTYDMNLYFDIDSIEKLLNTAKEQKRDWDRYEKNIPEFEVGTRVKVTTGRNAGKYGTITSIKSDSVMVDFGGSVVAENTRYPDAYWVNYENIEL